MLSEKALSVRTLDRTVLRISDLEPETESTDLGIGGWGGGK